MRCKVHVDLGLRSYDIEIGSNLLESLGELCTACGLKGRALIVTDSNVAPLYAEAGRNSIAATGIEAKVVVLPAGESSKSEEHLFDLYDAALAHKMSRDSFVLALGGGVVGDIAGYLAASYLRGIPFIQIPTTLLAMVDSSVGGKTGINLPHGKNLVGAFHQPRAVLSDIVLLDTLPEREWKAGLAEVIKYGVIADETFFEYIEENVGAIVAREPEPTIEIIRRSCGIKADVVRRDECENGLRAILNFGHTLGHAIENIAGYGKYLHGEAIAIGMAFAARLSTRMAEMPADQCAQIIAVLKRVGLPVIAEPEFDWEKIEQIMNRDKKALDGRPRFVLATSIGSAQPGYLCDMNICRELWYDLGQ